MAGNDNTDAPGAGNDDLRIEASALFFELRLAVEATIVGIKRIITRPVSPAVQAELAILLKLVEQGAEALNTLDAVLECFLRRHGGEAPGAS